MLLSLLSEPLYVYTWEVSGAVTDPKRQASKVGKEAGPFWESVGRVWGLWFRVCAIL